MHKNMHVRIYGSRGGAIPHGHPARATPWGPERKNVGALKGRNSQILSDLCRTTRRAPHGSRRDVSQPPFAHLSSRGGGD